MSGGCTLYDSSGYLTPVPTFTHDAELERVLTGLQAQADRLAEVKARARKVREHTR